MTQQYRHDDAEESIPNGSYPDFRLMVRQEIEAALDRHYQRCPMQTSAIENRVRTMETRFAAIVGGMIGSGAIGGTVAAALAKLL